MNYIIKRRETSEIISKKSWILVYGRRKVGKTFMLRDLCGFENYYTIKKDLSVIANKGTLPINSLIQEIKELLSQNKAIVIDEFQRLDESILEEIAILHPKGRVILSGSSLRVVKKIFEPKSPMLGFFTPYKIGFIRPTDIMLSLKQKFDYDKIIELATFLREPWIIPMYNNESTINFIYGLICESKYTIAALIGEIFTEEERELTIKYEAILNLIGSGIWNANELTSILYSRKLIPDPSQTHIIQYLKNLEEMELIESIKLHKRKEHYYRLISPIMNIYYYLDSRYDISNRTISLDEVKPTLEKLMHLEIQNFIADLFAELYKGRKEYYISMDKEVDFIITKRNKAEVIGEVKWKKITKEDISKFRRNSEDLHGKKILVCKQGKSEQEIEVITPKELIAMAQKA
ncbi:AAA family ATPase [Candidatus Woesearchaeota archaeon]|nr:AAA family ATPase [Candidatus Woesearchaeota archaeon]